MRLTKHHGLGNDFLILFAAVVPHDAPALARRLCNRTEGIGADGFIVLTPGAADSRLDRADAVMTLFNADGSLAEVSGNGLRCVGQALARRDGSEIGEYVIDTGGGRREVAVRGTDGNQADVAADMGLITPLDLDPAEALLAGLVGAARTGAATIANPHVVALVPDPAAIDLAAVGPVVEASVVGGVNVEFVRQATPDAIELTVWERGAGSTRACGSGACVAAWFARDWGLVGDVVEVRMPGGVAMVHFAESVTLVGPATHVADIEVP